MGILNFGSINWDKVYHVDHFPQPGETLAARSVEIGLGGKGLNHAIAIHRAGGKVRHLGAISSGDTEMRRRIEATGISSTDVIGIGGIETGSAQIFVDQTGENCIVLDPGANHQVPDDVVRHAINALEPGGDWLLMQNETNGLELAAQTARSKGIRVAMAAAPFDADAIIPLLPNIDFLAVNEVEFAQLEKAIGGRDALPRDSWLFVSHGSAGAELTVGADKISADAFKVDPVDTTGAGDTAFGALLGRIDLGDSPKEALAYAMAAGALQVTRHGAAEVIPTEAEVRAFLSESNAV